MRLRRTHFGLTCGPRRALLVLSFLGFINSLATLGSAQWIPNGDRSPVYQAGQVEPQQAEGNSILDSWLEDRQRMVHEEEEEARAGSRRGSHRNEIYVVEDRDYPASLFQSYPGVGQVSGIATLPTNDLVIFHRADRQWTADSFADNFTLNDPAPQDNLIPKDTIMILDGDSGGSVTTFGADLFYLPHGVASDHHGNLWITDVGRHQVMRFPVADKGRLRERRLPNNKTLLWPDIVLGEAFVPGSDQRHFCQPSEVAVSSNGKLVFVADGYCNQRVMVFTGSGRFLTEFGLEQNMLVVHSLALLERRNLVCAADREHARILCFRAGLDGNYATIGTPVLRLDYPLGRVFAMVSFQSNFLLVSSNRPGSTKFDLAALNPFTRDIKQVWTSSDLLFPHSLARTDNEQVAYAADISNSTMRKVFKFHVIQQDN